MLKKELEELRNRLNEMIASGQVEYDEILKISQQLDELLIKYMKEIDPCTGDKIKENGSQDPACNILLDIPEKYIFFFYDKNGRQLELSESYTVAFCVYYIFLLPQLIIIMD